MEKFIIDDLRQLKGMYDACPRLVLYVSVSHLIIGYWNHEAQSCNDGVKFELLTRRKVSDREREISITEHSNDIGDEISSDCGQLEDEAVF